MIVRILGFVLLWLAFSYLVRITVLRTSRIKTVAEAAQENAAYMQRMDEARAKAASAYLGIPGAEKVPQERLDRTPPGRR